MKRKRRHGRLPSLFWRKENGRLKEQFTFQRFSVRVKRRDAAAFPPLFRKENGRRAGLAYKYQFSLFHSVRSFLVQSLLNCFLHGKSFYSASHFPWNWDWAERTITLLLCVCPASSPFFDGFQMAWALAWQRNGISIRLLPCDPGFWCPAGYPLRESSLRKLTEGIEQKRASVRRYLLLSNSASANPLQIAKMSAPSDDLTCKLSEEGFSRLQGSPLQTDWTGKLSLVSLCGLELWKVEWSGEQSMADTCYSPHSDEDHGRGCPEGRQTVK